MFMNDFWNAFRESSITSSILAIILVAGTLAMTMNGQTVPEWLIVSTTSVIGFFYGQKSGQRGSIYQSNTAPTIETKATSEG